ncbi:MAG: 50S ribosomal protein L23 [Patescibacteria group bacterium]
MAKIEEKSKYAKTLVRPRITEKANILAEKNIHTFEVEPKATKLQIKNAIKAFYSVSPLKITIAKNPVKKVFVRGKKGNKSGVKKAYVYLKKGDKLE